MTRNELQDRFLDLLEENIGIIIKISRAYTKVSQDTEDLIHDITLELWKSYKKFRGNSKISTWIYRVALNTSLNYRRKKRNNKTYAISDLFKIKSQESLIEHISSSPSEILYSCIDELNSLDKGLILLYLDGNSHDEISKIMGISKTNVGTRIGRIKNQLKSLAISKS